MRVRKNSPVADATACVELKLNSSNIQSLFQMHMPYDGCRNVIVEILMSFPRVAMLDEP